MTDIFSGWRVVWRIATRLRLWQSKAEIATVKLLSSLTHTRPRTRGHGGWHHRCSPDPDRVHQSSHLARPLQRTALGWRAEAVAPLVVGGLPSDHNSNLPRQIQEYWQFRDRLHTTDDVMMMDFRIMIPTEFQAAILSTLHAADQGTSGMHSHDQECVFWPGITQVT